MDNWIFVIFILVSVQFYLGHAIKCHVCEMTYDELIHNWRNIACDNLEQSLKECATNEHACFIRDDGASITEGCGNNTDIPAICKKENNRSICYCHTEGCNNNDLTRSRLIHSIHAQPTDSIDNDDEDNMEASGYLRTDITMENRSESTLSGSITTEETDIDFSGGGDEKSTTVAIEPQKCDAAKLQESIAILVPVVVGTVSFLSVIYHNLF